MLKTVQIYDLPAGDKPCVFNPAFRAMNMDQIARRIKFNEEWAPKGFVHALYCPNTSTVYFFKSAMPISLMLKTMQREVATENKLRKVQKTEEEKRKLRRISKAEKAQNKNQITMPFVATEGKFLRSNGKLIAV